MENVVEEDIVVSWFSGAVIGFGGVKTLWGVAVFVVLVLVGWLFFRFKGRV